jgi:tRNA/tmRNA/rRNA uracil-C5-methylase (TrmA/RlmC/RlmD family)
MDVMDEPARRPAPGDVLELSVGQPVHGGWCLARPDARGGAAEPGARGGGPVIFVRHALPGERVVAVIREVTSRYCRAEAIRITIPAPDRVTPPCPYAGPGRCGGCDWQHASLAAQRRIKAQVVAEQLRRIAGLEREVVVEPIPGDPAGLRWRTRVRFSVRPDGTAGLLRHRSHQVVPVTDCLIAHPLISEAGVTRRRWPGARSVDVAVAPATGGRAVLVTAAAGAGREATPYLTQRAAGRDWRVAAAGFWQAHHGAADTLAAAVADLLAPRAGEHAVDIFAGSGLFAGVLAAAVGPAGTVLAIERDAVAAADARHNLAGTPWASVRTGDAAAELRAAGPDLEGVAVADPPRAGLGAELVTLLSRSRLRRIGYVSCEPATLARDVGLFRSRGWRLAALRAFDAFPMTHHVECVAALEPAAGAEAAGE